MYSLIESQKDNRIDTQPTSHLHFLFLILLLILWLSFA